MRDDVRAALDVFATLRPGELPFSQAPVRALFTFVERASRSELDEIIVDLATGLADRDAWRAGCAAISCGILVESGAQPTLVAIPIVERMIAAARDPASTEPHPGVPTALTMFDKAAMAHLCRSIEMRVAARELPGLDALTTDVTFTASVLDAVDNLELTVLAPAQQKGYVVRLEAVATNAHMFTLLQSALVRADRLAASGPPIDPDIVAIATGEAPHTKRVSDDQRFRFDAWWGIETLTTMRGNLSSFLPVDASPREIPVSPNGDRCVLLGPPLLGGRSWDSNFFLAIHDALRSRAVVVRELSADEVTRYLSALIAANEVAS
jgi:hypothetical protein